MVTPSVCLCLDSQTLAGVWTGLSPLWTGRRQPRLSVESEAWECVNVQSNQGPNRLFGGQLTKALKGRALKRRTEQPPLRRAIRMRNLRWWLLSVRSLDLVLHRFEVSNQPGPRWGPTQPFPRQLA